MNLDITNEDRAEWAKGAVNAFEVIVNGRVSPHPEDFKSHTQDLITNTFHLCDREGWSFEEMVARAAMHHGEEILQELEERSGW